MEYSEDIKSKCCIPYFETNAGGKRSKAGRIRTTKMLKLLCQNLLPERDWLVQCKYTF